VIAVARLLPQSFFAREALEVARDLLGCRLVSAGVTLRITEVEAYRTGGDTANHCVAGKTTRNAAMWGPPGHAYVYLCYGMHLMLNLVTDADGVGAAVLIRSAEVVSGWPSVVLRRLKDRPAPTSERARAWLTAGPGKVAQALGLTRDFDHHALFRAGGLEVREGLPPKVVVAGPRVGIDYAAPEHRDAPWRLADGESLCVTARAHLRGGV
jgi:DNA-3-methyladenine glycosylase